ncbi:hypothetical protein ASG87_16990 [Frateuria sp. Soil773]|uniref:transporter n=1 Tax=Frateuria sp. Soil773 TaxID=1736407 RepID=UPI0006F94465|nr:transporter [Frateuria sp. Soil773]KRE94976.1 hypothetical protein ASG87_16990 [Frateuria sp. Soil773]
MADFSRYHRRRPWSLALPGLLALGAAAAARADGPGYDRPGLGFSPTVLAPGTVAFEQGLPDWSRDRQDGASQSQYAFDSLLRIGLGHALELQLGGSPYNRLYQHGAGPDRTSHGRGDSSAGLKLALPSADPALQWGLLGSVEFTDGARDFRNAQRQYLLGVDVNLQLDERNGIAAYLEQLRQGGHGGGTLALSDSFAVTSALALYAEAAWQHVPAGGSGTLAGAGVAWQPTGHLQLDGSFRRRLGGRIPEWSAGLGLSVYFGQ